MPIFPVCVTTRGALFNRDMSHDTLKSHAKTRSLHSPPLSMAELFDICGEANEYVRNWHSDRKKGNSFAVVWLDSSPPVGNVLAKAIAVPRLEGDEELIICVSPADDYACVVLWAGGNIATTSTDEALRLAHLFFRDNSLSMDTFQTLNTAFSKVKEWSPTRVAAVVATAARSWCHDVDVVNEIEKLPEKDAFVVQYDGTVRCAEAAMADMLRDVTLQSELPLPLRTPASSSTSFNGVVNIFF